METLPTEYSNSDSDSSSSSSSSNTRTSASKSEIQENGTAEVAGGQASEYETEESSSESYDDYDPYSDFDIIWNQPIPEGEESFYDLLRSERPVVDAFQSALNTTYNMALQHESFHQLWPCLQVEADWMSYITLRAAEQVFGDASYTVPLPPPPPTTDNNNNNSNTDDVALSLTSPQGLPPRLEGRAGAVICLGVYDVVAFHSNPPVDYTVNHLKQNVQPTRYSVVCIPITAWDGGHYSQIVCFMDVERGVCVRAIHFDTFPVSTRARLNEGNARKIFENMCESGVLGDVFVDVSESSYSSTDSSSDSPTSTDDVSESEGNSSKKGGSGWFSRTKSTNGKANGDNNNNKRRRVCTVQLEFFPSMIRQKFSRANCMFMVFIERMLVFELIRAEEVGGSDSGGERKRRVDWKKGRREYERRERGLQSGSGSDSGGRKRGRKGVKKGVKKSSRKGVAATESGSESGGRRSAGKGVKKGAEKSSKKGVKASSNNINNTTTAGESKRHKKGVKVVVASGPQHRSDSSSEESTSSSSSSTHAEPATNGKASRGKRRRGGGRVSDYSEDDSTTSDDSSAPPKGATQKGVNETSRPVAVVDERSAKLAQQILDNLGVITRHRAELARKELRMDVGGQFVSWKRQRRAYKKRKAWEPEKLADWLKDKEEERRAREIAVKRTVADIASELADNTNNNNSNSGDTNNNNNTKKKGKKKEKSKKKRRFWQRKSGKSDKSQNAGGGNNEEEEGVKEVFIFEPTQPAFTSVFTPLVSDDSSGDSDLVYNFERSDYSPYSYSYSDST